VQYLKHHFPTVSCVTEFRTASDKTLLAMTTGTTTNSNKHVIMIYKCIIDRLTFNYLFIHE
jgi:hypothetical protein